MFWENSTQFHVFKFLCAYKHHFYPCSILFWLHPCGVAVNFLDDNMAYVSPIGYVWEFTCLICVHGLFHVICRYQFVMPSLMLVFYFVFTWCLRRLYWFVGEDALYFPPHVPLLCFFRFKEKFSDIIGVDEWPREIIPLSGGFEPCGFCRKTCFCM